MKKKLFTGIIAALLVLIAAVMLPALTGLNNPSYDETEAPYTGAEASQTAAQTESGTSEKETNHSKTRSAESKTESPTSDIGLYEAEGIKVNGSYTSKKDVALYIHIFGRLPDNYITKKQAQSLGWNGGSIEKYAPGKSIGGDYYGNYDGKLPKKQGRKYTECDIDTSGKSSRGAKRIVFSNDGLIYYTDDHYESFKKLY